MAQYLNKTNSIGVKVVGFFDDKSGDNIEIKVESNYNLPILGLISDSIPFMAFNLFSQWKRVFDIIFSSIILLILFLPMIVIGWLVKKEDNGLFFINISRSVNAVCHFIV